MFKAHKKIKGMDDAFAAGYAPEDLISRSIPADVYFQNFASDNFADFADFAEGVWTPPMSLEAAQVPPFPHHALPGPLGWYAKEVSRATQTPLILAASAALGAASIALARKIEVEPRPGWVEQPVLWILVLLASGERKTAAMNALRRPLDEWERDRRKELGSQIAQAESQKEILTRRLKEAEKGAARGDEDAAEVTLELARQLCEHEVPSLPKLTTSDTTQEAAAILCAQNEGKIAIWSDEGEIVKVIAGRYSKDQSPAVELFLKGYSGGYYSSSRVGRESVSLQDPAIPQVLSIQPGVIFGLGNQRALHEQGYFARPLYGLPPSALGSRKSRPEPADDRAREAYGELIKILLDIEMPKDEYEEISPHTLRFSQAADELLEDLQDWVEPQLGPSGEMRSFREWGSKFAGQVVRIAGILHLADRVTAGEESPWESPVERATLRRAIEIGLCYLEHGRAVMVEMGADPRIGCARHLLEVLKGSNIARISKRDLFDKVHKDSRFKTMDDLVPVIELLKEHGYVRELKPKKHRGPGRPRSVVLEVNPLPSNKTLPQNPQNSTPGGTKPFFEWLEERHGPEDPPSSPEPRELDPKGPSPAPKTLSPTGASGTHNRVPGKENAGTVGKEASSPNGHTPSTVVMAPVYHTETAKEYGLITDPGQLQELASWLEATEEVALDTETYPQDDTNSALDPRRGHVRLISVAAAAVSGVVDVRKVDPAPMLEVIKKKPLITHNASFDLSFLKNRFGYEHDGPIFDTQVLDAILYYATGPRKEKPDWKGFPGEVRHRSLKDVADDYLGEELSKEEQTSDFEQDALSEEQVLYALKDAQVLPPLKEVMMQRIRELGLEEVAELEARFTPARAYCQNNGFALDTEGWRKQALRAAEEAERIKAECDTLAPPLPENREEWNWASTKQVGEALELLGAEVPKHPTGNYKTDDATLKGIRSPERAAQLAKAILRRREALKRASTWGLGWFEPPKKKPKGKKFDKKHQIIVDRRVFSSFHQVVKTGRLSSSSPNLQNIPPELRQYFVAPPGRKLLIADYKQIELVAAAVITGEEKLLEAFRRGDDVHALTARRILESDPERKDQPVTEEEIETFRTKAKMVSFGILYGITAKGLARRITHQFKVPTSEEDAQDIMDRFHDAYPALKKWYRSERAKAYAGDDQTRTLYGRLRLLDKEKRYDGSWCTKPSLRLNTPVQGSAGDGYKAAVALLWARRRECPGNPKLVNMVHDEAVLEIEPEHAEPAKKWLEECMVEGMREVLGPEAPVTVEIIAANSWAEKE